MLFGEPTQFPLPLYRVTHQVVQNLPLTWKQKFRFGLACPGIVTLYMLWLRAINCHCQPGKLPKALRANYPFCFCNLQAQYKIIIIMTTSCGRTCMFQYLHRATFVTPYVNILRETGCLNFRVPHKRLRCLEYATCNPISEPKETASCQPKRDSVQLHFQEAFDVGEFEITL